MEIKSLTCRWLCMVLASSRFPTDTLNYSHSLYYHLCSIVVVIFFITVITSFHIKLAKKKTSHISLKNQWVRIYSEIHL